MEKEVYLKAYRDLSQEQRRALWPLKQKLAALGLTEQEQIEFIAKLGQKIIVMEATHGHS